MRTWKFTKVAHYTSFTAVHFRLSPRGPVFTFISIRLHPKTGDPHSVGGTNSPYSGGPDEVPERLFEIGQQALAYYRLTGSIEGYPKVQM